LVRLRLTEKQFQESSLKLVFSLNEVKRGRELNFVSPKLQRAKEQGNLFREIVTISRQKY